MIDQVAMEQQMIRIHRSYPVRNALANGKKATSHKYYVVIRLAECWNERNSLTFGPFRLPEDAARIRNVIVKSFATRLPSALAPMEYKHTPDHALYVGLYNKDIRVYTKHDKNSESYKQARRRAHAEWRAKNKWRVDEYRRKEREKSKLKKLQQGE